MRPYCQNLTVCTLYKIFLLHTSWLLQLHFAIENKCQMQQVPSHVKNTVTTYHLFANDSMASTIMQHI